MFTFISYYGQGDGFAGKITANGEIMDPNEYTCASWNYPLGTVLKIYKGKKFVYVKVNDRGGYGAADLSPIAFKRLAPLSCGIVNNVSIKVINHKQFISRKGNIKKFIRKLNI